MGSPGPPVDIGNPISGRVTPLRQVRDLDISALRWDDGWHYGDLRLQADPTVHRWIAENARERFGAELVLDLAAGTGALAKQLMDAGVSVHCTSWDGRCQVDCPTFPLDLDHDFGPEDLALEDGQRYDMVIACDIIEHVENPHALLRSCSAVLRTDGFLLVSTPHVGSARARVQWLLRGYPSAFGPEEIRGNRHISLMWEPGTEWTLAQAGFAIEERWAFGFYRRLPWWKRAVLRALEAVLPGEAAGTTRLYAARKVGDPRQLGAGDVY